ncbi:MAG: hypothetical protein DRI57_32785 [Deltaproteobacteria bacterium]|nr:MAG: hypothetical protein DRI57_32785 [Deltaproteobacteria bacterium]
MESNSQAAAHLPLAKERRNIMFGFRKRFTEGIAAVCVTVMMLAPTSVTAQETGDALEGI